MSIKRVSLPLVLVLFLGCAGSTVSAGSGNDDVSGRATAVIARDIDSASAEGIDLDIVQTAAPPVMGDQTSIDVQYTFEIRNRGTEPFTVKRITIWSAGGSYHIENRSRPFNKTVAPGQMEKIPFWARATGVTNLTGSDAPVTLRAEVEVSEAAGSRKATFVRNVGGRVTVGVSGQ